jgi:pimeloyl-ACP methyl ester carboxylesterase
MNRRSFLIQSAALAATASTPLAAGVQRPQARPRFRPSRFSVQVRGRGPDVVLIPGLTSSRTVWDAAVAAVPGFRYHLLQVSGFAGEPARGNAHGPVVAPLVEEIARYVESEGLRRPAIVGHSMGGTVGTMLALRHPDKVGKLMVVDMMPQPTSLFGGSTAGRLAESLSGLMQDPAGRQLLSSIVSAFSPPDPAERRSDPDVVARAMHDLGRINLTGELPRLRAPLTVVYAPRPDLGPAATDRSFAQAYAGARGARLVRIDNSGHMIMLQQPQRFAGALGAFLRA